MTEQERIEKNKVINSYKELKDTKSAKDLKKSFMETIVSYAHKMPDWGGLTVKMV